MSTYIRYPANGGGSGTVTSVALVMPGVFSVAGSPVTGDGTITVTLATETANKIWAGPTTGAAATPTFRSLVAADIPALSYVTSVGLSLPSFITVSNSPVTSSGTLTGVLATQAANKIFAGPSTGADAAPTFRSLVAADLPSTSLTSAHIFVGNVSNVATDVAMSGDITIDNTGATAIGAGKVTNTMLAGSIAYSKLVLTNSIVNADINSGAAIVYSKLSLGNSILNADINSSAAIAYSKLALSNSIVNADINTSAAIAYSKLTLTTSIVNGDISTSAAIARSKIASGSNNHVVINDGSGNLSSEASLAISRGGTGQATKAAGFDALSPMSASGDIIYGGTSGTGTALAKGTDGQFLKLASGVPAWVTAGFTAEYITADTSNGTGSSGTRIKKFTNVSSNTSSMTWSTSATNGYSVSIGANGTYSIFYSWDAASADQMAILKNVSGTTSTNPYSQATSAILALGRTVGSSGNPGNCSWTGPLVNGDTVWFGQGASADGTTALGLVRMARIA